MDSKHIIDQVHQNFLTHIRYFHDRHSSMKVIENDTMMVCDSGLACDTFNVIANVGFTNSSIKLIRDYIINARRPFSCWVGPLKVTLSQSLILEENGFKFDESERAMWFDLNQLNEMPFINNFSIKRVITDNDMLRFAGISASHWTPPDQNVITFYSMISEFALHKDCPVEFYIGYYEGEPVCTAEVVMENGVAGLYNISTHSSQRRKGLGLAMTMFCLSQAQKSGCTIGVLQASAEGYPLYQKIGFNVVGEYKEYRLT